MSVSDPIADMLTSIRNASGALKPTVQVPHSSMKAEVAKILKTEGYIQDYTTEGEKGKRVLCMYLKYDADNRPLIRGLKRISTPGRRHYVSFKEIPRVLGGIGVAILSTSTGLLTDQEARKQHTGGEVLCHIW